MSESLIPMGIVFLAISVIGGMVASGEQDDRGATIMGILAAGSVVILAVGIVLRQVA